MASTAAVSAETSSPRPMWRAEASAAASVTRTRSIARLRSMVCLSDAQEALEQRVGLGNEDTLLARFALVVGALLRRHVDGERRGVGRMRPAPAGRRVVRHHHHAPFTAAGTQAVEQRTEHVLVDPLDGGDFLLRVAQGTAL